jgi:hypothetical protein
MKKDELILKIRESLASAKSSLSAAEKWSQSLAKELGAPEDMIEARAHKLKITEVVEADESVVEGIFDGQNMVAPDGTQYPVPANYASKSKLIEGDQLKLTIQPNGAFIYKQVELIPRQLVTGHLILEGSQYKVLVDDKEYKVLYASVTFFRTNVGDMVTIIVPEEESSTWAAIENVLPEASKMKQED